MNTPQYLLDTSTEDLTAQIAELQAIQKTHRPTTPAWQTASELLEPLFEEMARRQQSVS